MLTHILGIPLRHRFGKYLLLIGLGIYTSGATLWGSESKAHPRAEDSRDSILRLPSLSSLLSGKAQSSQWIIEQPSYGVLTLQHGATIYIIDETPIASLQPQGVGKRSRPKGDNNKLLTTPTIKLLGRKIYISESAESCQILDITGQVVLSYRHAREVNLDIPPGVYMLRCLVGGQSIVCRIILR